MVRHYEIQPCRNSQIPHHTGRFIAHRLERNHPGNTTLIMPLAGDLHGILPLVGTVGHSRAHIAAGCPNIGPQAFSRIVHESQRGHTVL